MAYPYCKSGTIMGKDSVLEFAIACGDVDPETLAWLPFGYLRSKETTMSLDTIDTTTDSSVGSYRESDVTYKTFEISGDGLTRGDSAISNQLMLKDYVYNSGTTYCWLRKTSPVDTIVAYCIITEFSASDPYDDSSTFTFSAAATGRGDGLPSVIYTVTPQAPASVVVTPTSATVAKDDTVQLSASVLPSGAPQSVTWTSATPATATVSSTGLVTGVAAGSVVITATSVADTTKKKTVTVTVTA